MAQCTGQGSNLQEAKGVPEREAEDEGKQGAEGLPGEPGEGEEPAWRGEEDGGEERLRERAAAQGVPSVTLRLGILFGHGVGIRRRDCASSCGALPDIGDENGEEEVAVRCNEENPGEQRVGGVLTSREERRGKRDEGDHAEVDGEGGEERAREGGQRGGEAKRFVVQVAMKKRRQPTVGAGGSFGRVAVRVGQASCSGALASLSQMPSRTKSPAATVRPTRTRTA